MSDDFELSESQRAKLIEFIEQFDATHGDADFDCHGEWSDPELLALALGAAVFLGFEGEELEGFFAEEFGVAGITEGDLATLIGIAILADIESRIRARAGGRN